jgi:beta-fructofuranosidase
LQVVGFRDPQVWRAGQEWRLVLGSGLKGGSGVVLQYRSADLRHWDFINVLYSLGPDVDQGETCECPDFFALGDRHVLLFSTAGHTWYVIGLYDNDRFVPERSGKLDAGIYYAAKSMADASGQRVVWGWINGGRLYADMDNQGWAGVMSLPRVLEIRDGALMVSPLPALSQLEKQEFFNSETNLAVATNGPAARIRAKVQGAGRIIFANTDEFVHVIYDPTKVGHELSCNEMTAPLAPGDDHGLDIFVDASVIEIFTSTGVCLTSRAWGNATGSFRLRLEGGFKNARVLGNSMQPISDDRLTSTVS